MPKFSFKPVFVGWITLTAQLPFQLFFSFWAGGFFGGMAMSALSHFGIEKHFAITPPLIIGGLSL